MENITLISETKKSDIAFLNLENNEVTEEVYKQHYIKASVGDFTYSFNFAYSKDLSEMVINSASIYSENNPLNPKKVSFKNNKCEKGVKWGSNSNKTFFENFADITKESLKKEEITETVFNIIKWFLNIEKEPNKEEIKKEEGTNMATFRQIKYIAFLSKLSFTKIKEMELTKEEASNMIKELKNETVNTPEVKEETKETLQEREGKGLYTFGGVKLRTKKGGAMFTIDSIEKLINSNKIDISIQEIFYNDTIKEVELGNEITISKEKALQINKGKKEWSTFSYIATEEGQPVKKIAHDFIMEVKKQERKFRFIFTVKEEVKKEASLKVVNTVQEAKEAAEKIIEMRENKPEVKEIIDNNITPEQQKKLNHANKKSIERGNKGVISYKINVDGNIHAIIGFKGGLCKNDILQVTIFQDGSSCNGFIGKMEYKEELKEAENTQEVKEEVKEVFTWYQDKRNFKKNLAELFYHSNFNDIKTSLDNKHKNYNDKAVHWCTMIDSMDKILNIETTNIYNYSKAKTCKIEIIDEVKESIFENFLNKNNLKYFKRNGYFYVELVQAEKIEYTKEEGQQIQAPTAQEVDNNVITLKEIKEAKNNEPNKAKDENKNSKVIHKVENKINNETEVQKVNEPVKTTKVQPQSQEGYESLRVMELKSIKQTQNPTHKTAGMCTVPGGDAKLDTLELIAMTNINGQLSIDDFINSQSKSQERYEAKEKRKTLKPIKCRYKTVETIIKHYGYDWSRLIITGVDLKGKNLKRIKLPLDIYFFQNIKDKSLEKTILPDNADLRYYIFKDVCFYFTWVADNSLMPINKDFFQDVALKSVAGCCFPAIDYSYYNLAGVEMCQIFFDEGVKFPSDINFFKNVYSIHNSKLPALDYSNYDFTGVYIDDIDFAEGSILPADYMFFQKVRTGYGNIELPNSTVKNIHLYDLSNVHLNLSSYKLTEEQLLILRCKYYKEISGYKILLPKEAKKKKEEYKRTLSF